MVKHDHDNDHDQDHDINRTSTVSNTDTDTDTDTYSDSDSNQVVLPPPPPPQSTTAMPPLQLPPNLKFGPFSITPQVFHISPTRLSYGLVNLKPLLPGHVLVCSVRAVPRLSQLSATETSDLFTTVRRVSRTLERVYAAEGFNVAVQDGVEAGQSVPHVHVHVIPRHRRDMDRRGGGDAIYDLMDGEEGDLGREMIRMLRRRAERNVAADRSEFASSEDEHRVARGDDEMRLEAEWLRSEMEKDQDHDHLEVNRHEEEEAGKGV